jgi:hypothetical protein
MARRIVNAGELPVFFWGQAYFGAECYLIAALFVVFGIHWALADPLGPRPAGLLAALPSGRGLRPTCEGTLAVSVDVASGTGASTRAGSNLYAQPCLRRRRSEPVRTVARSSRSLTTRIHTHTGLGHVPGPARSSWSRTRSGSWVGLARLDACHALRGFDGPRRPSSTTLTRR